MCFAWKNSCVKNGEEPSLNEWRNFISFLAELSDNSIEMNFSGVEPLADERNLALIAFSSRCGLPTSMHTSAFLMDEEMARKIADTGLNEITISLDGITKDTHDFLRGVEGCYDKAIQAIGYLSKYCTNLRIGIGTIILERNMDEIARLAEWANRHERIGCIAFQAIAQPFFTPADDEWYNKSEYGFLWPKDLKKVHAVIDELIRLKTIGYKIGNSISQLLVFKKYFSSPNKFIKKNKCNVDFYMDVNQFGEVRMCNRRQIIGNIKRDQPKDMWYSKEANEVRKQAKNCNLNCHLLVNCVYEEE